MMHKIGLLFMLGGMTVSVSAHAMVSISLGFEVSGPPAAAPSNTMTVTDQSGAGLSQYPLQFGRPFLRGAIPAGFCPTVTINGVAASASQSDIKNRYPDGSVAYAIMATIIPSVAPNGSVTLGFVPSVSCDNTPLSSAQMLN